MCIFDCLHSDLHYFVMHHISYSSTIIKSSLCFLLLCIMGWQQWVTFTKYIDKFSAPIQYIRNTYGNDDISQYSSRFEEVKRMFPGETRLTYVSESIVPNAGTREMHFAIGQYNLAPNLLFRNNHVSDSMVYNSGASPVTFSSAIYDTVIYNLYSSVHLDANNNYYLNNGWHVVKDFNNGIIILAK